MNKDLFYIYDKLTLKRSELGECQSGFNMGLTIDGTKDTAKIIVWSYSGEEIEPSTICNHAKTNTWWVVKSDRVERQLDENGFVYVHNLQLLGAIELFNARDLTDCGFNQGTYTVGQFITRLVRLSNIELPLNVIAAPTAFKNKVVDYVKTYENYTLLSALRDFLDGYNMCAKLEFLTRVENNNTYLKDFKIVIIPKTGDSSLPSHDISEFDGVKETKTINQDSFGTTVVSNAENVISSSSKTFPSAGSVKLSSTQRVIVDDTNITDGVIRLPSKVFKGNWIKIVFPLELTLFVQGTVTHTFDCTYKRTNTSFENMIDYFAQKIYEDTGNQSIVDEFLEKADETLLEKLNLASVSTLYNDNKINAYTGEIIRGENVPYLASFRFDDPNHDEFKSVMFADKDVKNCLTDIRQAICWERGSNIISGFEMFSGGGMLQLEPSSTDYKGNAHVIQFTNSGITVTLNINTQTLRDVHTGGTSLAKQLSKISFIINYIPMADFKIKVDNDRDKRDIQLYNQNGRLTDGVALSKMLNSYAKEISSDNITKTKVYYNFNDVPKVGSFVTTPNGDYVVNNVSMDFAQDESRYATPNEFEYFIDCEISMSKYVANKSMMVNPNTNIRDYGIPQNYNVKRKQLYRDYYNFDYVADDSADNEYLLKPSIVFSFGDKPNEETNFICVMKLNYDELVDGAYNWYYQLETTTYQMSKMLYVVCDFNDNNIIGYSSQNTYSGFDITRVISGSTDNINTPISYVDSKGKVKGFNIKFCTKDQLTDMYDIYLLTHGGSSLEGSLYNYSCFIPEEIYSLVTTNNYAFAIIEDNYNKDAIEVPVFEYACQIGDSENVLIGDNVFPSVVGNVVYMYSFVKGEHLNQNNIVESEHITFDGDNTATLENAVNINLIDEETMSIRLMEEKYYYTDDMNFGENGDIDFEPNKDYAIFRHTFDILTNEETNVELVMIAKNVQPTQANSRVELIINHYRLN